MTLTDPLLRDLYAFLGEHRRCGDLDAGVDTECVWIDMHVRIGDQSSTGARCMRVPTEAPMRRIGLAVVLALSLIIAPLGVAAQQAGKVPLIVYLGYGVPGSDPSGIAGLRRGLREMGYVENQTIAIEYRYADNKDDRLAQIIAELSNRKVDVLIAQGTAVTTAAQRAAVRPPIVSVSGDPVGSGFAQSLARPGGNIAGLSFAVGETFGKMARARSRNTP